MTTFLDGPAKGQTLMLKRAPVFLRVVRDASRKVDALDQLDDLANPGEELFAYVAHANNGMVHINCGRRGGGFYPMVEYRLFDPQPSDAVMRANGSWRGWTREHANEVPRL